jgi:tRNA(Ile)-lysidine synthetase-like protein
MAVSLLQTAFSRVPAGPWTVGVSGGVDSVALLRALCDFALHVQPAVVHIDHQTRSGQSTSDARFVADLCLQLRVPCNLFSRDQLESLASRSSLALPANLAARFRALRHLAFAQLSPPRVLLAHHADDLAETIAFRLLRHGPLTSLRGIRSLAHVGPLLIRRPLLHLPKSQLRAYLLHLGQPWREDATNTSPAYTRNRIRQLLASQPDLTPALLSLGRAAGRYERSLASLDVPISPTLSADRLADLPPVLAYRAIARFLRSHSLSSTPALLSRIHHLCLDRATPSTLQLTPTHRLHRRKAWLHIIPVPPPGSIT